MAQKWFQKASVQAAIVSGVFLSLAAVIAGLFSFFAIRQTPPPTVHSEPDNATIISNEDRGQKSATLGRLVQTLNKRLASIEKYAGMVVEPKTGIAFLIGEQTRTTVPTPLTAQDVAFALQWAKEKPQKRFGCAFEPDQQHLQLQVRYFGGTEDTSTGHLLFNADKALKEYSIGLRFNGRKVLSTVSGYAPLKDARKERTEASFTRIWLADKAVVVSDSTGQASWLEKTGLEVLALSMTQREGKMVENNLSEPQAQFARSFSSQLDAYIEEEPALAGVNRLTQLISLSRASSNALESIDIVLSQHDFPVRRTPTSIQLLKATYEVTEPSPTGNTKHIFEISGGIDLGRTPSIKEDNMLFQLLVSQLPLNRSKLKLGDSSFIEVSGRQYIGIIVNPPK